MFIKEETKKEFYKLRRNVGIGMLSLIGLGCISLGTTQQVTATSQKTTISWDATKPMGKYTLVQLLNALKANPDKDIEEVLQSLINEVKEASQSSINPELNYAFRNAKSVAPVISNEKTENLISALYGRYARQADDELKKELITKFRVYKDNLMEQFKGGKLQNLNEKLSRDFNEFVYSIDQLKQEQNQAKEEKDKNKIKRIGKQRTDYHNAYMMSAGWNKDIALLLEYWGMTEKLETYKSLRKNMIISGIENAIHQVRDTDNPNGLYHQVAKYVGRINCSGKGFFTGTGTLVSWNGMPEELRGRVVLTATHNHYHDSYKMSIHKDKYEGQDFDEVWDQYLKKTLDPDMELQIGENQFINTNRARHPEQLSFSIDLSEDRNDIVACPPIKININNKHKTIDAEAFYTIGIVDGSVNNETIPDIAVCILKEPAIVDKEGGCNIEYIEADLNEDLQAFSIGYGRSSGIDGDDSYFEKYITGQYVKKSTPYFIFNKKIMGAKYGGLTMEGYLSAAGMMTGPSDSGGPIIYKKGNDYKIFSVVSGPSECLMTNVVVDWIKAVANYHVRLKASSADASNQPEISAQSNESKE